MAPPKRGAKKDRPEKEKAKAKDNSTAPPPPRTGIRKVAYDLARLTLVITVPYVAQQTYLYVHLRSGWLRPPVAHGEARQVLIVGSQSSGTVQTVKSLAKLGLEIAHEASDASTIFCRDGTVSWFHGIRFLPGSAPEGSLDMICGASLRNMGFHPAAFRRSSSCSYHKHWDACWARECRKLITESWGCAVTEGRTCETPFKRSLLQARHPLRTMESLVVKFCRNETAPPNPALTLFSVALWPDHEWQPQSCLPIVAWYVTLYYEAMMAAVDAGRIDAVYRAESIGVCDLARLAGFANESAFEPSRLAVAEACAFPGAGPGLNEDEVANTRNKGRVKLDRANLTVVSPTLAARVDALAKRMGYVIPP